MNAWESIFEQSRANKGYYNGDELAQRYWEWPRGTWFQSRLEHVREHEPLTGLKTLKHFLPADKAKLN